MNTEFRNRPSKSPGQMPGSQKRLLFIVVAAIFVMGIVAGGFWWFGNALPAVQAADAQASAQASGQAAKEAADKKKADDSAAFWAKVAADNKARSDQQSKDTAAFNASQTADRAADDAGTSDSIKRQMESQGWTQFSGPFYLQYAPSSEFTCGYLRCTYVHVTTMAADGCTGGIYVGASLERGGASIGLANSITAALTRGKDAIVKLEDTTGQSEGIRVTTLRCL